MLYNMMIGCYDIYDRFTTEHFTLRQGIPNFDGQFFFAHDSTYITIVIVYN
jgi:hypothetical protein